MIDSELVFVPFDNFHLLPDFCIDELVVMVTLGFVQSFLVSPGLAKIFYQRSDVEACNDDRNELRR